MDAFYIFQTFLLCDRLYLKKKLALPREIMNVIDSYYFQLVLQEFKEHMPSFLFPRFLLVGENGTERANFIKTFLLYYEGKSEYEYAPSQKSVVVCDDANHEYDCISDKIELLKGPEDFQTFMHNRRTLSQRMVAAHDPLSYRLIIIDNLRLNWIRNSSLEELVINGGHYRLNYLVSCESISSVSPDMRMQLNSFFLLSSCNEMTRRKLWDIYHTIFPLTDLTFEQFNGFCMTGMNDCKFMKFCTVNLLNLRESIMNYV
jgi:hypothetical protein